MATVLEQSNRPRGGRRFQPSAERALIGPAQLAAAALPSAHRGLRLIEELAGPIGVPDLTAVIGPPTALRARLESGIPALLNEVDAGVVAATHPSTPRSAQALANALSWPTETVERRLPQLLRSKALAEVRDGRYVRHPDLNPVGRLVAIETKVRDGLAAVRQCRAYTTWADTYVIVTGHLGPAATDRLMSQVVNDRAGLVIDGRWHARPRIRGHGRARRLWASEHVVAAMSGPHTGEGLR